MSKSKRTQGVAGKRPIKSRSTAKPSATDATIEWYKKMRRELQRKLQGKPVFDVDVASKADVSWGMSGGRKVPLLGTKGKVELRGHTIVASSIADFVDQVLELLDRHRGATIRRLRMFGHGVWGGGIVFTNDAAKKEDKNILTLRKKLSPTGDWKGQFEFVGGTQVAKLRGRFLKSRFLDGWVELHSCNVTAWDEGREFVRRLADLWDLRVYAGTLQQFTGSSTLDEFEGPVFVADGRKGTRPAGEPITSGEHPSYNVRLFSEGYVTGTEW